MFSPTLAKLSPYVPGEQPRLANLVKLNTNENPYPPAPGVSEALRTLSGDIQQLRRYPDPSSLRLREAVARAVNRDVEREGKDGSGPCLAENVFVGNGSDEVLALCFMAFFSGRDEPLQLPSVSYSFYRVYCDLLGIPMHEHEVSQATGWQVPIDRFFPAQGDGGRPTCGAVFANPNAPTGHSHSIDSVSEAARALTGRVVVVDEAYHGFGSGSAARLVFKEPFDNVLVTGTLSKSRSLAGIRVGYAVGPKPLIDALVAFKDSFNSYPIDSVASAVAIAALDDDAHYTEHCAKVVATREAAVEKLTSLGFEVLPSKANFVMAHVPKGTTGEALFTGLRKHGVIVRRFVGKGLDDYLRITIGTDPEMERLYQAIEAELK